MDKFGCVAKIFMIRSIYRIFLESFESVTNDTVVSHGVSYIKLKGQWIRKVLQLISCCRKNGMNRQPELFSSRPWFCRFLMIY